MPDLQKILGRIIRRERQEHQLTMKELGDKAGLSEIYIGEIERGQKYPSAKVLESIADALDLGIADLLEFTAEEIRVEQMPQPQGTMGFMLPVTTGTQPKIIIKQPGNRPSNILNFSDLLARHTA